MMSVLFASHAFLRERGDGRDGEVIRFTRDLKDIPDSPAWLKVLT